MENEVKDGLADVKIEGQDPFKDLDKAVEPSDSPAEKAQEVEKPVQGDTNTDDLNTPFHKHPRWIEREKELNTLRQKDEAREREIADLKQFKEQTTQRLSAIKGDSKIPEWFSTLYGDSPEAWEKYSEHDKQNREDMKREILEAQEQQFKQAQDQEKYWLKWVDDEMGKLESKGYKFDRNELADVMMKTRPTDSNGNLDFEAGYETYVARKGPTSNTPQSMARKQIADSAMKTSKTEPNKKDFMTSAELRRKSWNSL